MSETNGKENATKNAEGGIRLAPPSPFSGNRLRVGKGIGGKKGRSGRPHDEFKAALAALADETVQRGYVTRILRNHNHPQFMSALRWATDRGYGPVAQTHEVSGPSGGPITFTFKIERPGSDGDTP
jgi:hypothetical protein